MASSPCLLPDNILQKLICQECFRYLSVPPVVSNVLGESRCGRCYDPNDAKIETNNHNTKSLYNLVADERFLFRCINHYNGCSQLVGLAEAKQHEKTCIVPNQDCFFCSFSGVLSQIVYHCLKVHTENVTYDGKIYFFLNDMSFQRKTIYILNDNNIFLVTVSAVNELLTIEISTLTQTSPPETNQFGVKFFKPGDTSGVDYLHSNYGLLDIDLPNYFEKSKDELSSIFGSGVKVGCQILVGQYSFERELEFKEKFCKLSHCEEELSTLRKELADKEQQFLQQTVSWDEKLAESDQRCHFAIDLIKNMSYNFRCCGCQEISLEEIYCCPKNHFYCVKCLANVCRACDSVQEFKRLDQIGNFEVSCDWPGCEILTPIKSFIVHKTSCANRVYVCPSGRATCLKKIISLEMLLNHEQLECSYWPWSSFQDSSISCKINQSIDCCWIVNGDLYHVTMQLDKIIRVTIDDVDVINKNVTFKCGGSTSNGQNINFLNFCRKCDLSNFNSYYNSIIITIA